MPTRAAGPGAPPDSGLTLRRLTAGAGSFRLGPVDLAVPPGRVLVVLGPSGAGKTVLLETISGLRQQLSGQIRLAGTELTGLAPERRGIGLVFQDAALFPHLSVRENIRFGPRARGLAADAATADSLLSRLGIGHLAGRSPRTLSGGERQRAALARALAIRPGLLLLDEPLSALDQPTREEMRTLLQQLLADLDIPAVHVTHDRDEALTIGDDLAIIIGGRLIQVGPASRVTAAPADPGAARLLGWSYLGPGTIAEPGIVRVGQFTFPGVAGPQVTGTVQVYYRPEDVLLGSQSLGTAGLGTDSVAAVIGEIVPTRPLARISLASDPPLTALILHRDLERLRAQPGDPVTAALPPASVLAFGPDLKAPPTSLRYSSKTRARITAAENTQIRAPRGGTLLCRKPYPTLRQLITFLIGVENDRLAALWWLIALRGLRRGEAAALNRDDLDSKARELTITRQLVALPGELYCGPPKSRASYRTIALDKDGTRRLVDQAVKQAVELLRHQFTGQRYPDSRTRTGPGWRQGRPMFTYADGRPVRPEYLTHRFNTLVREFDLPPIRLHDLRHGAATLALASHTDLKVIQQVPRHYRRHVYQRPAGDRAPRRPGHRRHGHQGRPQRPGIPAQRDHRAPCPGRSDRLRLLPDVSSSSSTSCYTRIPG